MTLTGRDGGGHGWAEAGLLTTPRIMKANATVASAIAGREKKPGF
jgi:hypothetical protein